MAAYSPITLTSSAALFDNLGALSGETTFTGRALPLWMETLGAAEGYMLYSLALPAMANGPYALSLSSVADFAVVYVNGVFCGTVFRPNAGKAQVPLPTAALSSPGARLDILVENMGHINYGRGFFDPKGLTGSVLINSAPLKSSNWTAVPLGLNAQSVDALPFAPGAPAAASSPAFYRGVLNIASSPADTYLTLCGWGKGQVYVNGFHLGRHWASNGPQHTYYIPAGLLVSGANTFTVFEQVGAPANASIAFSAAPDFRGTVCGLAEQPFAPLRSSPLASLGRRALSSAALPPAAPPAAAAPPAPTGAQPCTPGAIPQEGDNLTIEQCSSTPAAALSWQWVAVSGEAGVLALASNATLCVAQVGKNPNSGEPNYALAVCDKGDRSQHLLPFPSNGKTMLNPVSGKCVEAFGGENSGPGSRVEGYDCNGGANQGWVLSGSGTVQVVNQQAQLCLAACG